MKKRKCGLEDVVGKRAVVVDVETTGISFPIRVVQLAVVDLWTGAALVDTLVHPDVHEGEGFELTTGAITTHGLTREKLKDAPRWEDVRPRVQEVFSRSDCMVAYNVEYDMGVLRAHDKASAELHLKRLPLKFPPKVRCVMTAYAGVHGRWSDYWGNYEWVKLGVAARRLGVEVVNAHSALGDALTARGVALALLREEGTYSG